MPPAKVSSFPICPTFHFLVFLPTFHPASENSSPALKMVPCFLTWSFLFHFVCTSVFRMELFFLSVLFILLHSLQVDPVSSTVLWGFLVSPRNSGTIWLCGCSLFCYPLFCGCSFAPSSVPVSTPVVSPLSSSFHSLSS